MPTLTWNELNDAAGDIFRVWVGQPELKFAEEAWILLAKAGLAAFESELEQVQVKIRFMALACAYLDFCGLAWDEKIEADFGEWSHLLGVDLFRVGQLVGTGDEECNEARSEFEFKSLALHLLSQRCRAEVHRDLVAGYGSEANLYSAMWHSRQGPKTMAAECDGEEWDVTGPNSAAYEFVAAGFCRT